MHSIVPITELLHDPRLWRGRSSNDRSALLTESTGYAALNASLPGGGWPIGALSECLCDVPGVGELQLILPTLARLTRVGRHIAMIGAPHVPYPNAWLAEGVDLAYLHLVVASSQEKLWATEQCLRSGACGAVICWPQQAHEKSLRRLQTAAETGRAIGFVYRSTHTAQQPSPAAVRIKVLTQPNGTWLKVVKCRGGPVPSQVFPLRNSMQWL